MIETTNNNGICTIRLAHGKASAMDIELLEELRAAFRQLGDARALILTGTGTIFSAGVDLVRLTNDGEDYADRFFLSMSGFFRELFELPIPVIAAVNGHAIAGGALMAMASDYRIMARGKGRFGVPELVVGVRFPAVPLEIVRYAVSPERVQALIYGAQNLLPDDALAAGLVDELVDAEQLNDRATAIAKQLAAIPTENFAAAKKFLRANAVKRMDEEGADQDTRRSWSSSDTHQRIRDYLARLKS